MAEAVVLDFPASYLNRTRDIDAPSLKISQLRYEPYPVEPGEYFTLWIKLANLGNTEALNVIVEFVEDDVFSIDKPAVRTLGRLGSRQEIVLKYEKVRVAETALDGDLDLTFRYTSGGGYLNEFLTETVPITVRSVRPLLSVDIASSPTPIPQGTVGDIKVSLRNEDTSLLKDLRVTLNLPSFFVPIGSTNEKKLQTLAPKQESLLVFQIMPLGDAESRAYSIPIELEYSDKVGNLQTRNQSLGILIGEAPAFDVNLEESTIVKSGSKGKVVLSIANVGLSELKFLTLELLPGTGYAVLGPTKSYVGNLESDDFETVEYQLFATQSGQIPLSLRLRYKDAYNREQETQVDVPFTVFSTWQAWRYGIDGTQGNAWKVVVYIVLALFVYFTYREWRRERDLGKAMKAGVRLTILSGLSLLAQLRWRNLRRLPRRIRLFLSQ